MRAIKFRAWDVLSKTMDEDAQAKFWLSQGFDQEEFKDSYVFMQYTGLKDKNGKEIYEGDLMRVSDESPVHKVEYVVDDACWYLWAESSQCYFLLAGSRNIMEIIGNIYENPELLNSDKEVQGSVARDEAQRTEP